MNDYKGLYNRFGKAYKDEAVRVQTQMLIDYAPLALFKAYVGKSFQNDTLNLRDSYGWAVYYNGIEKKHGYLTDNKEAQTNSYFHGQSIDGRKEVSNFISQYTPIIESGWELMLVAAAPYSVCLEGEGFYVLSAAFDEVTREFKGKGEIDFILHTY